MDENGFFFIVDRLKDMIIVSGLNVYPRDVEEMLNEHAAVRECAVYGVPDERTGEQVNAAVVLNLGAHPIADDLRTYLQQALAGYQVPRVIEFLDELPKSPIGKILKKICVRPGTHKSRLVRSFQKLPWIKRPKP